MKERPILFSGPMVRAILEGRKTQTRRVVAGEHGDHPAIWIEQRDDGKWVGGRDGTEWDIRCPYGEHGDRLWVRETWRTGASLDEHNATQIAESARDAGWPKPWAPLLYTADEHRDNADTLGSFGGTWGRVRSARFMPRWASRITLAVTSVRVERLNAITEDDARAEGVNAAAGTHRSTFAALWDEINGKRAAWHADPWVWVIGFERARDERRTA